MEENQRHDDDPDAPRADAQDAQPAIDPGEVDLDTSDPELEPVESMPPEGDRLADSAEASNDAMPQSDERAESAYDFLCDVLDKMHVDVEVRRRKPRKESSADEIRLEIIGRDAGRVIGKKGQVLAALQYLLNRVSNRPGQPRRHVVLDAEGYRERRESSLAAMAKRLGAQASEEGKIITFEPMNPRDRRIVHLALAGFPDVVTRSDGEGEDRRVRIIPVRK